MSTSAVRREKPKQEDQKPIVSFRFFFLFFFSLFFCLRRSEFLSFFPTNTNNSLFFYSRANVQGPFPCDNSLPLQAFIYCVFFLARWTFKGQRETRKRERNATNNALAAPPRFAPLPEDKSTPYKSYRRVAGATPARFLPALSLSLSHRDAISCYLELT